MPKESSWPATLLKLSSTAEREKNKLFDNQSRLVFSYWFWDKFLFNRYAYLQCIEHLEFHNPIASENIFWNKGLICIGRAGIIVSASMNILMCFCKDWIQSKLED